MKRKKKNKKKKNHVEKTGKPEKNRKKISDYETKMLMRSGVYIDLGLYASQTIFCSFHKISLSAPFRCSSAAGLYLPIIQTTCRPYKIHRKTRGCVTARYSAWSQR